MTTFHIINKTFSAIFTGRLTTILLPRHDQLAVDDRVNFCCDESATAVTAIVADIHYSSKHADLMMVTIKNREATDYDLCDFTD